MHKQATGRQPWHFSGTNLTLGEALRLLLLLCGPPWLFAVFIILTRLAVPPTTALEWIPLRRSGSGSLGRLHLGCCRWAHAVGPAEGIR